MDPSTQGGADALALYRAEQVQELDRRAIASGIAGFELMGRAGMAAFRCLQQHWPQHSPIEIFCGGGNNGGDGYVVAALAAQAGMAVRVWALSQQLRGDAATAAELARDSGVDIYPWSGQQPAPAAVIVDALLGSGFHGALRDDYAAAIAVINASACPVLAIDLPSGLSGDTGMHGGDAVRASRTLSFIGWQRGLFTGVAAQYRGDLALDRLGLDASLYAGCQPSAWRIDAAARLREWGRRPQAAHKGMFGHVLVAGGDYGMAGAVILAASAAARCGAGLISCASRADHVPAILAQRPEVMAQPLSETADLSPFIDRASVLVVGPGLGQGDWGRRILDQCLAAEAPLLMDADALNLLAAAPQAYLQRCLEQPGRLRVMTPHPGEAARLLACTVAELQADRFAACRALAQRYRAVVLLKGAGTVISDGEACWVNEGGNPGMASGGMGDVLSGMIAALIAQGLDAAEACCLGAALHCRAADRAAEAGQRGLLAMDVVAELRGVINDL